MTRVLGVVHAVVAALAGAVALLIASAAVRIGEVLTAIALTCVACAGGAVLAGVLRRHRGALRVATLLYAAAALLLLRAQDSFLPAAVAAALFAGTVALALQPQPSQVAAPPQP